MRRPLAVAALAAFAVVVAGPASPGQAAVIAPSAAAVITLPGSALGAVGATGGGITTAAVTASSTGLGMNVAATGVGGGATAVGAAAPVAGPALAAAGAFVVGYGIGTFACGHISFCADDEIAPSNPAYLPNTDVGIDPGTCPVADLVVGASRTCGFALQSGGVTGTVQVTRYAVDGSCGTPNFPNGVTDSPIPTATGCWHATLTDSNGVGPPEAGLVLGPADLSTRAEVCTTGAGGNPCSVWFRTGPQVGYFTWATFAVRDTVNSTLTPPNPMLWGRTDVASGPVDPERTFVTHGQCVKGAVLQQVTETSRVFVESEGHIPKYPDVACPAGFGLIGVQVHKITPSLSPGDDVVWEWEPDPDTDPWAAVPKLYPECAGGACVLRLWRLLDGSRVNCFGTPGACRGWFADPDKADNYECTYGTHLMPLADCDPYRPTFDVLVELDGGPKTETSPDPGLGTDPGTHADPDGTVTDGDPVTDPGASRQCPPDAGFLSFLNPFWLFDTLKCAFVPTQVGLRAGWESAGVDWCETAPGALICASDALVAPFGELGNGSDADCLGAAVTIPNTLTDNPDDDGEVHPFQACGQLAQVSDWWLLFASAAIYLGTALTAARILGGTIGAREAVPA